MRKATLLVGMAAICCNLLAKPVSSTMARQKAMTFIHARGIQANTLRQETIRTDTKKQATPPYHIFNQDGDKGFVVVAGDDIAGDIMAYSDKGNLNPEQMPEGVKALLDGYAAEIEAMKKAQAHKAASTSNTASTTLRQAITPLIETRWGQGSPYNAECLMANGRQAAAGFGACAMAQVLYYYRTKVNATEIPAYTTTKGETYDALPAPAIEWQDMLTDYGDNAGSEAEYAVAHLMMYAGRAIKTSYGSTTSTADIANCPGALSSLFGFENNAVMLQRDQCGTDEWEEMIYNELQHGRPVIYAASNSLNSTHIFICDGYDGQDLYHINWGQGGDYDGFYRLQAFNLTSHNAPNSTTTYGYSMSHKAVVGICPDTVDDDYGTPTGEAPTATYASLTVNGVQQVTANPQWKVVRATVTNNGTTDYSGIMRLQLNGSYASTENIYVAAGKQDFVDFHIAKEPGSYVLKVVEKKSGKTIYQDDDFTLDSTSADNNVINLLDQNTTVIDEETKTMWGETFETQFMLSNMSDNDYHGKVTLTLYVIEEGEGTAFLICTPKTDSVPIMLPAGKTKTFTITSNHLSTGDKFYYALELPGQTITKADAFHPYTVSEGYNYWNSEGRRHAAAWEEMVEIPENAAAVSLERHDLSTVTITPNDNPNTIYYVSSETDIPEALENRNVVANGKAADDITLCDNYSFCVPMTFHADRVSYTHTFVEGSNSREGWQEVSLPFAVETVVAGGKELTWCHGHDGNNYDFWLMAPTVVSGDTVYMEATDKWMGGMTYFIAVPDDRWDASFDLCGKAVTFSGSNVWMTKCHGTPFTSNTQYEGMTVVNNTSIIGDANNDGTISIADVMKIVKYILGVEQPMLPLFMGDTDQNNQLTVADVMGVVNKILN